MAKGLRLWVDGSHLWGSERGGWGFVLEQNDRELWHGSGALEDCPDSLHAEMAAVVEALAATNLVEPRGVLWLVTDCQRIVAGARSPDARGADLPAALWGEFDRLRHVRPALLRLVKGHNGHRWHDRADQLARKASRAGRPAGSVRSPRGLG